MQTDKNRMEVLNFANQTQAGFLGSMDGGRPRVRGVLLWFADESGFYFHTSRSKDLHRQLQETPFTEVAFFRPEPPPAGTMLRVSGRVEFLDDPQLKERLLKERPWLQAYRARLQQGTNQEGSRDPVAVEAGSASGPDNLLSIFRIVRAECRFWTGETNMREKEAPTITFP